MREKQSFRVERMPWLATLMGASVLILVAVWRGGRVVVEVMVGVAAMQGQMAMQAVQEVEGVVVVDMELLGENMVVLLVVVVQVEEMVVEVAILREESMVVDMEAEEVKVGVQEEQLVVVGVVEQGVEVAAAVVGAEWGEVGKAEAAAGAGGMVLEGIGRAARRRRV